MDDSVTGEISRLLQKASSEAEALEARIEAGEAVSDDDLTTVARAVADAIEEANDRLRAIVAPSGVGGPRRRPSDPEALEGWSEDNLALREYRAWKKEKGPG
ncbi:MAG TPA: hypothetical protein VMI31_02775 [Fimbriimonadaceae bacterium]|nr:hypothetical protein [Fimbriimonadaceae bacterium]